MELCFPPPPLSLLNGGNWTLPPARLLPGGTSNPGTAATSHLEEFEKRSAGPVRGDAKKYALEQAQGFVVRFGLPPEFHPLEEGETRFKEACQVLVIVSIAPLSLILTRVIQQIYNWFKNTIGRKRRQAEGKPRSVKSANSASNSKVKGMSFVQISFFLSPWRQIAQEVIELIFGFM